MASSTRPDELPTPRPVVGAVWEITLRCNLHCTHCGSRAGVARDRELTTEEALDLVEQLADVGVTEVVLIGGEAYLRRDWETIAGAIVAAGMECGMTTGGWGLTAALADRLVGAGLTRVSVSIDGLEDTHDDLRGRVGSWRQCFEALGHLKRVGLLPNVNTQLNRRSVPELPRLYGHLGAAGVGGWQVQFTGPMGRAADVPALPIQPAELPVAHDVLARVAARAWADGIVVAPGFNVGYFGPHERQIRGNGAPYAFWQGPDQGLRTVGIESDGTVKPELTLPTAVYRAGNVRDSPLRELLHAPVMGFAARITGDRLSGFCAGCEFGDVCLGGDPWMAHLLTGGIGDNPFCDHRARALARSGRRERVQLVEAAPGQPYDFGRIVTVDEPIDAEWPFPERPLLSADEVMWPQEWVDPPHHAAKRAVGRDVDLAPPAEGHPLPLPRAGTGLRRVAELVSAKRRLDRCAATQPPGGHPLAPGGSPAD